MENSEKKEPDLKELAKKDEMMAKFMPILEKLDPILEDFTKQYIESTGQKIDRPVSFGFSIKIEPTGETKIEELGAKSENVPENKKSEPLIDIIESAESVTIVAEIRQIELKDINVEIENKKVFYISAKSKENPFLKKIELNSAIVPESGKAKFNNGILEMQFEKEKTQ